MIRMRAKWVLSLLGEAQLLRCHVSDAVYLRFAQDYGIQ